MSSYIDKVAESIRNVQKQLLEVSRATKEANRSSEAYFKHLEDRGRAAEGDAKRWGDAIQRQLAPHAKNSTFIRAGLAVKIARDNKILADSYREHEKAIASLSDTVKGYEDQLEDQLDKLTTPGTSPEDVEQIERLRKATERKNKEASRALAEHQVALASMNTQETQLAIAGANVVESLEAIGYAFRGLGAIVGYKFLSAAVEYLAQSNDALVDANVNITIRNRLYEQSLRTAAHLGVALSDVTNAQAALADRGFDLEGVSDRTLQNILRMETGLGATVGPTVHLLASVEAVGGRFDDVCNSISRVVDVTSIAADEAVRYATELSKIALITGQKGGNIGEATRLVSAVEGQLKRYGLDSGSFMDLIKQANSIEGIGMSLMHGGGFQQMVEDPEYMKQFVAEISRISQGMGSVGRQVYAEARGIDPGLMALLAEHPEEIFEAMAEAQKELKNDELLTRYREQIALTNKAYERASKSLNNLALVGLAPLAKLSIYASKFVAGLSDGISRFLSGDYFNDSDDLGSRIGRFVQRTIIKAFTFGVPLTFLALVARDFMVIRLKVVQLWQAFMALGRFAGSAHFAIDRLTASVARLGATSTTAAGGVGAAASAAGVPDAGVPDVRGGRGKRFGGVKGIIGGTIISLIIGEIFEQASSAVENSSLSVDTKESTQTGLGIVGFISQSVAFIYHNSIIKGLKKGWKELKGLDFSKLLSSDGLFARVAKSIGSKIGKIGSLLSKVPGASGILSKVGTLTEFFGKLVPKIPAFSKIFAKLGSLSPKFVAKAAGKLFFWATTAWDAVEGIYNASDKFGRPATTLDYVKSSVHEVLDSWAGLIDLIADDALGLDISTRNVLDRLFGVKQRQEGSVAKMVEARGVIWDNISGNLERRRRAQFDRDIAWVESYSQGDGMSRLQDRLKTDPASFDQALESIRRVAESNLDAFEGEERERAASRVEEAMRPIIDLPFTIADQMRAKLGALPEERLIQISEQLRDINPEGGYDQSGAWVNYNYDTARFSRFLNVAEGLLQPNVETNFVEDVGEVGTDYVVPRPTSPEIQLAMQPVVEAVNAVSTGVAEVIETLERTSDTALQTAQRQTQRTAKPSF